MQLHLKDQVQIIPKPDEISWHEITHLIHRAFAVRADQGLMYIAVNQDVETTKSRVGDGICLVAVFNGQLIGTGTLTFKEGKKWFEGRTHGYMSQLGVDPKFKGYGAASLLAKRMLELCHEKGVDSFTFHTAYDAHNMLEWHKRWGAQKVAVTAGKLKTYYSVHMRYGIKKKRYNSMYAWLRYNISLLICVITKKKGGSTRGWIKWLK